MCNKGSGLRPSGFIWQVTSARLAGDVIQVWINSSSSNHCISHFKAQLVQLFLIHHLICTYWIKGIFCGYAIRSGRHPSGSQQLGRPVVGPVAADFPRDVCLTVSRIAYYIYIYISSSSDFPIKLPFLLKIIFTSIFHKYNVSLTKLVTKLSSKLISKQFMFD